MPKAFELLRERLLRGGIGAAQASRYITELQDHLEQLVIEEQAAGHAPREAYARARQRLGDADVLSEAMIAHRQLRTWASRAPITAYVLTPSAVLTAGIVLLMAALGPVFTWLRRADLGPSDVAAWAEPFAQGAARYYTMSLSVLLGLALVATAARRRTPPFWPVLGLIVLAAVGATVRLGVVLPMTGVRGEISVGAGYPGYWGRFAIDLVATLAPYGLFRLWLRAHSPERVA